jgi:hypothetical protein
MWHRLRRLFKRNWDHEAVFTGNCMVFQHTGDGHYVGRCYHSTYDGRCPTHGDVSACLDDLVNWPNDYDLEPNR